MIWNFLIDGLFAILEAIFYFMPVVTIADIAYVGETISSVLYAMMGRWNAFMATFPYAQDAWELTLWIIIPFELLMLTVRLFLGSHVPIHHE